ncbi:XRE family transcriptional regulator [Streptomyces albus]|uniref:helix-turn-helix domain-containing protein n=1 Tax=Streptomyces physcomitrii TaxID=2724184 RepID=UPI000696FA51|nr:XRE family transcriptional regulator [Streptomyces albus]
MREAEEQVSGPKDHGRPEGFASLLREVKDRSGLSYGTLAKRLHMSTSTLHRYCNGTAVPTDYAPVERFARLCRATPAELVELHRQWILADASRGSRPGPSTGGDPEGKQQEKDGKGEKDGKSEKEGRESGAAAASEAPVAGAASASGSVADIASASAPNSPSPSATSSPSPARTPSPSSASSPRWLRRRRVALVASLVAAAVLGSAALALTLPDGDADEAGRKADPEVTSGPDGEKSGKPTGKASPSASEPKGSTSPSGRASETSVPVKPGSHGGSEEAAGGDPLSVAVRPYTYAEPCSQHFLVNRDPSQVGPPADEPNAPRWAAAYGAVSSDEQRVALTVQGTGKDTVVLEALHVRVISSGAPLAWNDYAMAVGCGGRVVPKEFGLDLDKSSPAVVAQGSQGDFPYKVSESDPEVFYINARSKAHDVRWEMSLEWSSGSRRGTVRIDNRGQPFRTSANADRPGYDFPLGSVEWQRRVEQEE